MSLLDEVGRFWWSDETIPEGHYAPDTSVTGSIKISDDGVTKLKLDGFLPGGPTNPLRALVERNDMLVGKSIQGLLKDSNKRVLISDIFRDGTKLAFNGISYEGFSGLQCLVTEAPRFPTAMSPLFDTVEFDVNCLGDWLAHETIAVDQVADVWTATYRKPEDIVFNTAQGRLEIRSELDVPYFRSQTRILEGREITYLRMCSSEPEGIEKIKKQVVALQDFLFLFIGVISRLEWPFVWNMGQNDRCKLYFARDGRQAPEPEKSDWWIWFADVKDVFGALFENWMSQRTKFGPGFYLYLGTLRNERIYAEHRFVNLVWAVESFHRTKHEDKKINQLTQKVARIVDQIEAGKDKRWLKGRLRNADEPSLKDRIVEVYSALPLRFEGASLRRFAERCAKCRNDISHFGGSREKSDYQEFLSELDDLSDALSSLHHAILLKEIGLSDKALSEALIGGWASQKVRPALSRAGVTIEEWSKR